LVLAAPSDAQRYSNVTLGYPNVTL
jgi:hypothetical protein